MVVILNSLAVLVSTTHYLCTAPVCIAGVVLETLPTLNLYHCDHPNSHSVPCFHYCTMKVWFTQSQFYAALTIDIQNIYALT